VGLGLAGLLVEVEFGIIEVLLLDCPDGELAVAPADGLIVIPENGLIVIPAWGGVGWTKNPTEDEDVSD
jgi:hypothetical protein